MIFENMYICQYCGKECKNFNSLRQHEIRCNMNPNRLNLKVYSKGHKGSNQYIKAEQLGLEKPKVSNETRNKLSKLSKGRKYGDDYKLKISNIRKKYLNEHPDKVPFLLSHPSKISYPEKYFIDIFYKENIPLKYHKQVHRYELDFYNEDLMKYVEIDGEQHYSDYMIAHDKERDQYLTNLGWIGIRIRWSEYQSMNDNDKHHVIESIRQFIQ